MTDLRTRWLGFDLQCPIVMAGSPMSLDADAVARAVDAGVGAVVLPSLFEIPQSTAPRHDTESPPSGTFLDERGPFLRQLERLRKRFSVPIVASLNATSPFIWAGIAKDLEGAGASAIELNLYEVASSVERDAASIEHRQLDVARAVVDAVKLPVNAKLSMFYTSVPAFTAALMSVGIAGVSLFNRFYQPDINLETMDVDRRLHLSTSLELPPRLHALAALWRPSVDGTPPLWLACTGGVHTGEDAAKSIVCGAHVVMMASALLREGPEHVGVVRRGLAHWLDAKGYTSVDEARGLLSLHKVKDPDVWTRLNYVRQLGSWEPRAADDVG